MHCSRLAIVATCVVSAVSLAEGPYKRCGAEGAQCQAVPQVFSAGLPRAGAERAINSTAAAPALADAAVLESIIRQRVSSVTQQMLRDILMAAAHDEALPEVLEDLLGVLAAVPVSAADKETLSQLLTMATLRITLVTGIGGAVQDSGCSDVNARFDAVYEGLAASRVAHQLGFVAARGVVPQGCNALAERVTRWADAVGIVGEVPKLESDLKSLQSCAPAGAPAPSGAESSLSDRMKELTKIRVSDRYCQALLESTSERLAAGLLLNPDAPSIASLKVSDDFSIKPATLQAIQRLLFALAHGSPLSRGDVVTVIVELKGVLAAKWPKKDDKPVRADAKAIVDAFLVSLPNAIREDAKAPGGLKMDGVALAADMVSNYVDEHREGFYIRATIGTGVLIGFSTTANPAPTPSLHEELGLGFRWRPGAGAIAKSLLIGPHIGVSGLLYKLQLNGQATDNLFVFGGASINLYRLIDVSLSLGLLHNTTTNIDRFGVTLSLQVPLGDYVKEAATSHSTDASQ